jgi:sugar phosphate isomerase/epimerase
VTRRQLLATLAAARPALSATPTEFQVACMTLVYSAFSFDRAIQGIASAGYRYVVWGPHHTNSAGQRTPTLAEDAPASEAARLARRTRDAGLEPLYFFGVTYPERPEAVDVYKRRIEQAKAAGIPAILTFGSPKGTPDDKSVWVKHLRAIGKVAQDAGVIIGVKQHGGVTGTGRQTLEVVREVGVPSVQLYYDAGNVWWYENVDPRVDTEPFASLIRGFAIKDYRAVGDKRAICGPGFGVVDHFRLFHPLAQTGHKIPVACENIFEPFVPRPDAPERVDALARHARNHLEGVVRGVLAV